MKEEIKKGTKVKILDKTKGDRLSLFKSSYDEFPFAYFVKINPDGVYVLGNKKDTFEHNTGNFFNREDFEIVEEEKKEPFKIGDKLELISLPKNSTKSHWLNKVFTVTDYTPHNGWFRLENKELDLHDWIDKDQRKYFQLLTSSTKNLEEEGQVSTKMAQFNEGDKVLVITAHDGSSIGDQGEYKDDRIWYTSGKNKSLNCSHLDYWELVSSANKTMVSRVTLSTSQKKNLSKDAQALVEVGWYDSALNLTNSSHFINFLKEKFETEYATAAKAALADDDAEKAKAAKKTA